MPDIISMPTNRARFCIKKYTLTPRERVMFFSLKLICKNQHVLAQYPMSQLLEVKGGTDNQNLWRWRKVSQKVLDFLIVDKDFKPLLAIELDDYRHQLPNRKAADAKKDAALREAGIPIARILVADLPQYGKYSFQLCQDKVQQAMLKAAS